MIRKTSRTSSSYCRNSCMYTNVATASSIIGSILGLVEAMEGSTNLSLLTFTVQGCSKVGSTVAKELVRLGANKVQMCNLHQDAADIVECVPIKDCVME